MLVKDFLRQDDYNLRGWERSFGTGQRAGVTKQRVE